MAAGKTRGEKSGAFMGECGSCDNSREKQGVRGKAERAKAQNEEEEREIAQVERELEQQTDDSNLKGDSGGEPLDFHNLDTLGRVGLELVAMIPQIMGSGASSPSGMQSLGWR